MPGRRANNQNYRYGFNGKEKDDSGEWGSNTNYDYGFRIYNPAIGKFLSVDPLTASYPWYTPYQFAGNKPIWAIDVDGLEEKIVVHSRTVGKEFKAALDNGDFYDGASAVEWLSTHNHQGKYPNGVLGVPWDDKGDHTWLDNLRAKDIDIPNQVSQVTHDMTIGLGNSVAMWLEDVIDPHGNIGVRYNIVLFTRDEDGGYTYTIPEGITIYADGIGADIDISAGTEDGGSYGIVDWGDSLPGGGVGQSKKYIWMNGMKYLIGLLTRSDFVEEKIDGIQNDLPNAVNGSEPSIIYDTTDLGIEDDHETFPFNEMRAAGKGDTIKAVQTRKKLITSDTIGGGTGERIIRSKEEIQYLKNKNGGATIIDN